MNPLRHIATVIAAVALALLFVGAGFLVCIQPPVTTALANNFSDDVTSPFTRSQLVRVAEATRDYSFGDRQNGRVDLMHAIYDVDVEYRSLIESEGGTVPLGFPALDAVGQSGGGDWSQQARAFESASAGASEMYSYSQDTLSHLDDCYAVFLAARVALAIAVIAAIAALVACGMLGGMRQQGAALMGAGIGVLVAGVALGVWAAVDFTGFFATFHGVFFSQGNWTFPYDSLLICALPEPFWAGMGALWLVVTIALCALSVFVGKKLRKR